MTKIPTINVPGLKIALLPHTFSCITLLTIFNTSAVPVCNFVDLSQTILICNPSNTSDFILKPGVVSDNNNIEAITLRGCKITDLDHDALQNLYSLKYVDLSENNLEELSADIFNRAPEIEFMNLSKNLLYELPVKIFKHTPNVIVLDLMENRLDTLYLGTFDPLVKLKTLELSWNNFLGRDLHPLLFKHNINISSISFSGNDMNDTPDKLLESLELLETLNLNGCAIHEVPAFATKINLKTMKELILSSNQLNKLDDKTKFVYMENLELLDLAENEIEYVAENVFTPLKNLKVIKLQNNKLKYLPIDLFINMPFLENVDVSHNIITTVSVNTFRNKPLSILNLSFNRLTYLTKNFCAQLKETGANLTEFYFHQNPWQCACLNDILHEVEDFNLLHITDVPGYWRPVCVTSRDYRCKRDDIFNNEFIDIYDKIKMVGAKRNWGSLRRCVSSE